MNASPSAPAVRRSTRALFALSFLSIAGGGLLPAITARFPSQTANWASAYLVLVAGIGTAGLLYGAITLGHTKLTLATLWATFGLWLAGNALTIIGSLASLPWLVLIGGLQLWSALALILGLIRGGTRPRATRTLVVILIALLAVSVPVGVVLSFLK